MRLGRDTDICARSQDTMDACILRKFEDGSPVGRIHGHETFCQSSSGYVSRTINAYDLDTESTSGADGRALISAAA